jgi:hypothetical protein
MLVKPTFTLSLLAAALAVTAYGQAGPAGKAAPARATAAKGIPRTPDGHPDLQGNWLNNAATPFERPKELAARPTLSDEEVIELNRRAKAIFSNPQSDAATSDGVFMAAYNNLKVYKSGGATDSAERVTELIIDNRTSTITDPPDGKLPAYTPEGQKRRAAYGRSRSAGGLSPDGPDQVSPSDRCISYGVPRVNGVYASGLHGYYQIVQTKDQMVLFSENVHEVRTFDLTGSAHLPASVRGWAGDSRGHWEGDTLVVDTTNFRAQLHPLGISEKFHLTERFTRVSADEIHYEMTLDDPETWVKPWTAMIRLKRTDDNLYECACHEGNERIMQTILLGDRQK